MHILYVHQNFPAQFGHLASYLSRRRGFHCTFVSQKPPGTVGKIRRIQYQLKGGASQGTHPLGRPYEDFTWHSHAVYEALRAHPDVRPDLIVGHSGFGSTLFLQEVLKCPVVNFFEWFYRGDGSDSEFLGPMKANEWMSSTARNSMLLADLHACALGYSPTGWQRSRFPNEYQGKLATIFDGIETDFWRRLRMPDGAARRIGNHTIPDGRRIVTYVSRGFESMRGFDLFMQVAKRICQRRDDVVFVCVGSDRVCYGGDLNRIKEKSFREHVLKQDDFDLERILFVGNVPPRELVKLLSLSDLHLYLTVPFVLSWSLMDALACGCTVLASDTPPLREVIEHGKNGLLAPFYDVDRWVELALAVLDDPPAYQRKLGESGVETIHQRYSMERVVPQMLDLYERARQGKLPDQVSAAAPLGEGLSVHGQPRRGLAALQARHPWPERPPRGTPTHAAWLNDSTRDLLGRAADQPRLVVELGAWRGQGTRELAQLWPDAEVLAIDHWPGCDRRAGHPEWKTLAPEGFEAFMRNCWEFRERIVPVRRNLVAGLREIAAAKLQPDLVFLDCDYDAGLAAETVQTAVSLFPHTVLVGDDWHWWASRRSAMAAAAGRQLEVRGNAWCLWPLGSPVPASNAPRTNAQIGAGAGTGRD